MAPLEAIEKAAEGIAQSLIMCAHTHIARAVKLRDGRMVVNPGSVGLPGYRANHPPHVVEAGTPDARYAILELRDGSWRVTFRHVPYDHGAAIYLAECRRMGIKVLPPCVNSSDADFTPTDSDIRFGLTAVRNVGSNVVASVVEHPHHEGRVRRLRRLPPQGRGSRVQQAHHRGLDQGRRIRLAAAIPASGLMHVFEAAVDTVLDTKRAEAIGQFDLFGGMGDPSRAGRRRLRGAGARRRVGQEDPAAVRARDARPLRLRPPAARPGAHPRRVRRHDVAAVQAERPATSRDRHAGRHPVVGEPAGDQGGRAWAPAILEDLEGSIEVMFFPATYPQVALNDRRGRDRRRQGAHRRPRGRGRSSSPRDLSSSTPARARGPGGRCAWQAGPLHPADGGPAAGRARHPPRDDRGAPAAGQRVSRTAAASADELPGHAVAGADGGSEGAARAGRGLGLRRAALTARARRHCAGPDAGTARLGSLGDMNPALPERRPATGGPGCRRCRRAGRTARGCRPTTSASSGRVGR